MDRRLAMDGLGESQPRGRRYLLALAALLLLLLVLGLAQGQGTWADPAQDSLRSTIVAQLNGHVDLQGHPAPPHARLIIPVQVVIEYPAGGVYRSVVVTTTNTGDFIVPSVDPATYHISAKGYHTLRVRVNNVVVVTPTTSVNFGTLPEGDANNDNTINAIDASLLSTAYWKSTGDPGFDWRADFNDDGTINALDASLMATNYWQTGALLGNP